MLLMKLAVVTCAIYLGLHFLIYAAFMILVRKDIIVGIHFSSRIGPFVLIALIWLLSFSVAWRIVMVPVLARPHH